MYKIMVTLLITGLVGTIGLQHHQLTIVSKRADQLERSLQVKAIHSAEKAAGMSFRQKPYCERFKHKLKSKETGKVLTSIEVQRCAGDSGEFPFRVSEKTLNRALIGTWKYPQKMVTR